MSDSQCSISPLPRLHPGSHETNGTAPPPQAPSLVLDDKVCKEDVVIGDPIVGRTHGDVGPARVRVLKAPPEMTAEQFAKHCLTHLPMCSGCKYCAQCTKPNIQHRRSTHSRKIPLLAADYAFLTEEKSGDVVPILVVYLKPFRVYFATVVDSKGADPNVVKRLSRWILECGLTHFVYRSGREPALRTMLKEAIKMAGVKGEEPSPDDPDSDSEAEPIIGVPEQSHVGESQSNGLAERAIQTIEGQVRCMKLALEDRLQCSIPCSHPSWHGWLNMPRCL